MKVRQFLLSSLNNYCARMRRFEIRHSSVCPTFRCALEWPENVALKDEFGEHTYRTMFRYSKEVSDRMNDTLDARYQQRVAFLCPNNVFYVTAQWACWMSGQIAVPLCQSHPISMMEYFIVDSDAELIITTDEFSEKLTPLADKLNKKLIILEKDLLDMLKNDNSARMRSLKGGCDPSRYPKWNALILYTSGSTAMPKGVVLSYENLTSQVNSLLKAWEWTGRDAILHSLPLHHTHGLVNALLCPFHVGAKCVMLPKFDAAQVWAQLLDQSDNVNVFMGVPTMYVKLIQEYENSFEKSDEIVNFVKATCSQKIRLMVSGSAPLPMTVYEKWHQITGHCLLERYGMTEIGMALSNPLHGLRKPGFVGKPLPGVSVRITNGDLVLVTGTEDGNKISRTADKKPIIGELQAKGRNIFREYWGKPEITKQEFTTDGWFKTGDSAELLEDYYRILGRTSVDIIKSGGYKISALFVETTLLQHPLIIDIAVVGIADNTWGQKIVALIVTKENRKIETKELKVWCKENVPPYAIPAIFKIIPEIPRNATGKVNKKQLVKEMFNQM